MKQIIALIIVGILVIGGGFVYLRYGGELEQQEVAPFENSVAYLCANNKVLAAGFSEGLATVVLDDSRVFTLEQVVSASGTRYANDGEQVVFFTKGEEAFLEENGIATYTGCMVKVEGAPATPDGGTTTPPTDSNGSAGGCYVGGCSSQVCSENPDVVTTCEFRSEYACYQSATCERQASGECGWTETPELLSCLENAQ